MDLGRYDVIPSPGLGKAHFGTLVAVRERATAEGGVAKVYRRCQEEALLMIREKNLLLVMQRTGSPYIIQYLDDFMDQRHGYYIVMGPACRETMEGRVRRARRRDAARPVRGGQQAMGQDGSYSYATVLRYLHEIAQGLAALHDMDIIHCDLALRNILLTADDHVRISDLGVAYDAPQGGLLSAILMKNSFFLVPGAKEAPAKVEFDKPSDCWTFGYCASLMVCKELPSVPSGIPPAIRTRQGPC